MRTFRKLSFILVFALAALSINAQSTSSAWTDDELRENPHWQTMMLEDNVNFFEVKRAYNLYFENHEKGRGTGYKIFERWANFVENRVLPDGSLKSASSIYDAYYKYQEEMSLKGPTSNKGNWEEIGPKNLPDNVNGGVNGTGRINAIAFHPTDTLIFWVGAPNGGLWRTDDGGTIFTNLTDQLPTIGISSILIHPTNPSIIYIGTGDDDGGNSYGMGIFKSTDGGANWTLINSGMGDKTVAEMIMNPTNSDIIIAATNGGIYRTTNAGNSWTLVSSNAANYRDLKSHPTDPNYLYATANGSFYYSSDNGQSWSLTTSGLIANDRMVIGTSPDEPDAVLCLLIGGSQLFQGIFKSTDKGLNFTRITSSSHANILGYVDGDSKSQATYDLTILIDPLDVDHILVGSVNVHESTDGGANFTKKSNWTDTVHADQHKLMMHPVTSRIFLGNDGGLYYSDDWFGANEVNISDGLATGQAYRLGQYAQERDLFIAGFQDNGTVLFDNGKVSTVRGGDGMECLIDYSNKKHVYGTYIDNLLYSNAYGYAPSTWSCIARDGLNGVDEGGAWVTPYMLHVTNPNVYFFGFKNIWRSTNVKDNPPTWVKISDNLGGTNVYNFRAVEQSRADTNIFYAVRENNTFFRSDNVNDAAPDWVNLSSNLPVSGGKLVDVECHPTDSEIVYIIQDNKVYKSMDKGQTWTDFTGSIPSGTQLNCFTYDRNSDEGIYVGTETSIYYKDATMSDWVPFDAKLPVTSVRELDIYYGATDSRIKAATFGRGIWQSRLYTDTTNTPIANFNASTTTTLTNETVKLYDKSKYLPTSWTWSITPSSYVFVNGTNANSINPEIQFTAAGTYSITLQVSNSIGSDSKIIQSYISAYDILAAPCTPATQNLGNYSIGVYNFTLNTINRSSGQPVDDNPNSPEGYMDFSKSDITTLQASTTYDLSATFGNSNSVYWNVYIDYNNDGDFDDTGEEVYVAPSKVTGEQNITITTPASPSSNNLLRLRIICDYYSISGPCMDPAYGQAEDYGVIFTDPPVLTTATVSGIASDTAVSGGNISSQGSSAIIQRGIVYGLFENPTLSNNWGSTEDGSGTGNFTSNITNLQANTKYYVRAYAINSEGVAYGQSESFTTDDEAPEVSTTDPSDVLYFKATCGGNVTSDGGRNVSVRGVVYDTAANPTISRCLEKAEIGSGTGSFNSVIKGLTPDVTYYVRAYARNSYSVSYGTEKSFTTLPPDPDQSKDVVFTDVTTNKMTISWTNGTGAKRIVKIDTDNDYTSPVDGTDPVADTVYAGGEQVVYNGSGNSVTVTGLSPSTKYYVFVYDYNGSGGSTSYNIAPGTQNPASKETYCLPTYTNGDSGTHIEGFTLNTINNSSGASHYSDYTDQSTALLPGFTYDVSFTMSYNKEQLSLWIDCNDDSYFDASEKLVDDYYCAANTTTTTTITIPADAEYGKHLMRVRAAWGNGETPCSEGSWGEAEDYIVDIKEYMTWLGNSSSNWSDSTEWDVGIVPVDSVDVFIPLSPIGGNFPESSTSKAMYCKDLMIEAGAHLFVEAGDSLTVTGTLDNNAGTNGLVLKADNTGVASLIHNTNNVDAEVQSYLSEDTWHLVSAPINNALAGLFTDLYLYRFDEADYTWHYITDVNTDLTEGKGFFVWSKADSTGNATINYSGILNNGDISVSGLSYTASQPNDKRGWNMLGNPYPSFINWNSNWTLNNVDATAYIYDGSNYLTWNGSTGTHPNGDLAPGQGFWVKANASGASVTIPQSERKHSTQQFYKNNAENQILMSLSGNGLEDKAMIIFNDKATVEFDNQYDAWKIKGDPQAPQLYSIFGDAGMTVNALPKQEKMSIPLGVEVGVTGNYTLSFNDFTIVSDLYLEDLQSGKTYKINPDFEYHFVANTGDEAHRFNLHFGNALNIEEDDITPLNIYSLNSKIYIQSTDILGGELEIYNMVGKKVFTTKLYGEDYYCIPITLSEGAYIISLRTNKKVLSQKLFIK